MKVLNIDFDDNFFVINDSFDKLDIITFKDKFLDISENINQNNLYDYIESLKVKKVVIKSLEQDFSEYFKQIIFICNLLKIEVYLITENQINLGVLEFNQINCKAIISDEIVERFNLISNNKDITSSIGFVTSSSLKNFINNLSYEIYSSSDCNVVDEILNIQTDTSSIGFAESKELEEIVFDSNEIQWNQSLKLNQPNFKHLFDSNKVLNYFDLDI